MLDLASIAAARSRATREADNGCAAPRSTLRSRSPPMYGIPHARSSSTAHVASGH